MKNESGSEQGKTKMDKFGSNVIAKIERNHVEELKVHGEIWKRHRRDLIYTAMLEIQIGDNEMMNKGIFAYWRNPGQDNNRNNQKR